jgi:hypothetical protein
VSSKLFHKLIQKIYETFFRTRGRSCVGGRQCRLTYWRRRVQSRWGHVLKLCDPTLQHLNRRQKVLPEFKYFPREKSKIKFFISKTIKNCRDLDASEASASFLISSKSCMFSWIRSSSCRLWAQPIPSQIFFFQKPSAAIFKMESKN